MKPFFLICILFFSFYGESLSAQLLSKRYYDYKWGLCSPEYARFYAEIYQTDTGYFRTNYFVTETGYSQMRGLYADSATTIEHGIFYYFHPNKQLEKYGRYVHGKKEGLWLSYYPSGMMKDSIYHVKGDTIKSFSWYSNGYLSDSFSLNEDGKAISVGWFDNGSPSYAGIYKNGQKQGKWKYFHKNGNPSAIEVYEMGIPKEINYFDEEGNPQDVTYSTIDTIFSPLFRGANKRWLDYIRSKTNFPTDYKIKNSDKATTVLSFTVTEEGKISDVYITVPFHEQFDEIAKKVIENLPAEWKPAIHHNRKITSRVNQSLTWNQEY